VAGSTVVSARNVALTSATYLPLTIQANTGTGAVSWSATGLPAGLSVSGTNIVGTPTALDSGGPSHVTVTATDSTAQSTSVTFSWSIINPPGIATVAAQWSYVNAPLSVPLTVTGGTGTFSWTSTLNGVAWGSVAGSGSSPVFTGTPTTASNSAQTVSLTVTDTATRATATTSFPLQVVMTGHIAAVIGLSGQCVDVLGASTATGATVQSYACSTTATVNQTWTLAANGNLTWNANATTTNCLTAANASAGALITSEPCRTPVSPMQTWSVVAVTGGQQLVLNNTPRCLAVSGSSVSNGQPLDLATCTDSTRTSRDTWMAR
jgi:hypothetical protein